MVPLSIGQIGKFLKGDYVALSLGQMLKKEREKVGKRERKQEKQSREREKE